MIQIFKLLDPFIISIISISNLILGTIVLLNNRKNKANQTFFGFVVFVTIWILSAFVSEFFISDFYKILLSKITMASGILAFVFFFYFSFYYPIKRHLNYFLSLLILISCTILVVVILFSNFLIQGLIYKPAGFDLVYNSFGMNLFLSYFLLLIGVSANNFIRSYIKVNRFQKLQLQYLFLGFILVVIFIIIVDVILPRIIGSETYYRLGNYSVIFFIAFTTYAIVKHQLMEIRVVLANVLVFIIGIILFAQIFISSDLPSTVLRAVLFVFYAYFGYLLIKSVLKEIEQRKQLEELTLRLKKANKRLRELDKLKDEFISVASHDLRVPIAVIEGYLSMVLSEKTGRLPSKARELLEKVYFSTRYLAMLSRDVLETSRINQKRLKLDLALNDIKEVVSNMVDQFQVNAQEKGIYLKAHLPKRNIPKFMFDKQRIEEVLQNLITNAIKFTDKGGIEVGVEVRPGQKLQPKYKKKVDKEILVWVKDTGVGIPKDKLSYVFGKFTQVRNDLTRDKHGTGLGLFICKSIIDLHGGKIWVVSEGDGRGSTFFFTLPFLKNE